MSKLGPVHRSRRKPKSYLWISAGPKFNESSCASFAELAKDLAPDKADHVMFANSENFGHFPGMTYRVDVSGCGSLAEKYRAVVLSAHHEGAIDQADIVVTPSWVASMFVRSLSLERLRYRRRPIVTVMTTTTDVQGGYGTSVLDPTDEWWFWVVVGKGQFHCLVLDNDREMELYHSQLRTACPNGTSKTIQRLRQYQFDNTKFGQQKKRDGRVIWSGRWNGSKDPDTSLEIAALLAVDGVPFEMFVPTELGVKYGDVAEDMAAAAKAKLNIGLSQSEYFAAIESAEVALIASHIEAFPMAYIEICERGVIPVLRRRPWSKTFLGEGWPLFFDSAAEGFEMVREAMANPKKYRAELLSRMKTRYGPSRNAREVFGNVWAHYLSRSYEDEVVPKPWMKGRVH